MNIYQKNKNYLLAALLLFAIFLSITHYFVEENIFNQNAQKVALENAHKKILERENVFREFLYKSEQSLKSIRESSFFEDYLHSSKNINILEEIFVTITNSQPDIMQLRYIDKNGIEKIRIDRYNNNISPKIINQKNLQDKSNRYYFKHSKQEELEKVWFSALDLNIENGRIDIPYRPTLRAVLPISNNNQFGGILIINYLMKDFLRKFTHAPLYDMILFNNEGYILRHYEQKKSWSFYKKNKFTIKEEYPKEFERILNSNELKTSSFISKKLELPIYNNLYLILKLNSKYLNEQKEKTTKHYLLLSIIIIIFAILLYYIISRFFKQMLLDIEEKEKINSQLEKIKIKHNIALEGVEIGIWEWDYNSSNFVWDDLMYKIYETSKYSDINPYEIWKSCINSKNLYDVEQKLFDAAHNNTPFDMSFEINTPNNKQKYIKAFAINIYDKNNKPYKMIGVNQDITKQKNLENEIIKEKNFISSIVDNANAIIAVIYPDGTMKKLNKYGQNFTGYSEEEISKEPFLWIKFLDDNIKDKVLDIIENAKQGQIVKSFQNNWISKDGQRKMFEWSNSLVNKKDGSLDYIFTIGLDIDEKIKIQQELKESQLRWEFAVEGSGDGLWDWNLETNNVYFSKQWKNMLGFEEHEIQNNIKEWESRVNPEHLDSVYESINNYLSGQTDIYKSKHQVICKNGNYKWILDRGIIVQKDSNGKPLRMIGTHTDIDDTIKLNNIIQNQKNLYEILFDKSPDAYFIMNIDDAKIKDCNLAALDILNGTKNEIIGLSVEDVSPKYQPDGQLSVLAAKEKINLAIEQNKIRFEWVHKRLDDKEFWTEVTAGIVKIDNIDSIFVAWRDISENKKLEEEILKSKYEAENANKAKSQFLANMSHEIRTPLNGIIGLTELIMDTNLSNIQKDYLEKSKKSSYALLNVINDILDYSKIEAGKLDIVNSKFDFNELLKNIFGLFEYKAYEKNLEFKMYIDENIPNILIGDALRITQVLNNLIGNSIKFTKKGFISLEAHIMDKTNNTIKIKVSVQDSGIGISEDKKQTLFQAFEQGDSSTTKEYGGTGLGLMITKELINLMNGEIWFESKENTGSNFEFTLRLEYVDNQIKTENIENNHKSIKLKETKNALLVEDNNTNQIVATRVLEKKGFNIDIANNGLEAVNMSKSNTYDIIFMDLQMPVMDGFDATVKIREFDTKTPIVALSAAVMKEDKIQTKKAGMNMHIAKPINKEELDNVIKTYFQIENNQYHDNNQTNSNLINIDGIDIKSLCEDMSNDINEVYKLLTSFKDTYINQLQNFNSNKNSKDFKEFIHKLKGVSGNLKMKDIFELCKKIEQENNEENINNLKQILKNTLKVLDKSLPQESTKELISDSEFENIFNQLINDINDYKFINPEIVEKITNYFKSKIKEHEDISKIETLFKQHNLDELKDILIRLKNLV
jgi:PAS domain S-box-containing protein